MKGITSSGFRIFREAAAIQRDDAYATVDAIGQYMAAGILPRYTQDQHSPLTDQDSSFDPRSSASGSPNIFLAYSVIGSGVDASCVVQIGIATPWST